MPPVVIHLRNADDLRDVVHRTVQALAEGELVALPTETVYGLAASALDEKAVARLLEAKGRRDGKPLTLALKSADEARDYVPDMCPLARRLARWCWPGPVTLVIARQAPGEPGPSFAAEGPAGRLARWYGRPSRAGPPGGARSLADAGRAAGLDQREP